MRRTILVLALALIVGASHAQPRERIYRSLFPEYGTYLRKGWVFSPSVNFLMPSFKHEYQRLWTDSKEIYDVEYRGSGKMGVGFEFGRFHVIDQSRLISYVSLSMGIKYLRGVERYEATLYDPNRENPMTRKGEGVFSHTNATMSFDASNAKRLSQHTFLENTLGINGDYRLMDKEQYNKQGLPIQLNSPTRLILQAHYRIGFGMKLRENMMIVPSLETPIVTFYEYQDLKSTLEVFNSRYRPLIVRVNIMLLDRRASRTCPTKNPPRKRNEQLFGKNMTQSR